ncbi:MAG: hypothetical protein PHY93_06600 [Bacteriovorax sp.]|nr:hypothetical protein [Bacteriovorax sp.]
MANVKCFYKKQFSFLVILIAMSGFGSFSFQAKADTNPQMINLNMQFKAKNKTLKSDLSMPFYQTAELEKHFDNKNVLIEVNPRRGKNSNEVAIEMRFYKSSGAKAFAKKEIIAKLGEESKITVKGMTVRVTPVL